DGATRIHRRGWLYRVRSSGSYVHAWRKDLDGRRIDTNAGPTHHHPMDGAPHVVALGGGFGGLYAAQALRRVPVRVALVDRRNPHCFQPLLYQVAGAELNPSDIAAPIRAIVRGQKNVTVLLDEAIGFDLDARKVQLIGGALAYDYLIVATGATH